MTPNTKEESHFVRDKHNNPLSSSSKSLQTASDGEENDIAVTTAQPSCAVIYLDRPLCDISHVRDGKPKSDSDAISKYAITIKMNIVAVESRLFQRGQKPKQLYKNNVDNVIDSLKQIEQDSTKPENLATLSYYPSM